MTSNTHHIGNIYAEKVQQLQKVLQQEIKLCSDRYCAELPVDPQHLAHIYQLFIAMFICARDVEKLVLSHQLNSIDSTTVEPSLTILSDDDFLSFFKPNQTIDATTIKLLDQMLKHARPNATEGQIEAFIERSWLSSSAVLQPTKIRSLKTELKLGFNHYLNMRAEVELQSYLTQLRLTEQQKWFMSAQMGFFAQVSGYHKNFETLGQVLKAQDSRAITQRAIQQLVFAHSNQEVSRLIQKVCAQHGVATEVILQQQHGAHFGYKIQFSSTDTRLLSTGHYNNGLKKWLEDIGVESSIAVPHSNETHAQQPTITFVPKDFVKLFKALDYQPNSDLLQQVNIMGPVGEELDHCFQVVHRWLEHQSYLNFEGHPSSVEDTAKAIVNQQSLLTLMAPEPAQLHPGMTEFCNEHQQHLQEFGNDQQRYVLKVNGVEHQLAYVFAQNVYDDLLAKISTGQSKISIAARNHWQFRGATMSRQEIQQAQKTAQRFNVHREMLKNLPQLLQDKKSSLLTRESLADCRQFFVFIQGRAEAAKKRLIRLQSESGHRSKIAEQQHLVDMYAVTVKELSLFLIAATVQQTGDSLVHIKEFIHPEHHSNGMFDSSVLAEFRTNWLATHQEASSKTDGVQIENPVATQASSQPKSIKEPKQYIALEVANVFKEQDNKQQQKKSPQKETPSLLKNIDMRSVGLIFMMTLMLASDLFFFDALTILWPLPIIFFVGAFLCHLYEVYQEMDHIAQIDNGLQVLEALPAKSIAGDQKQRTAKVGVLVNDVCQHVTALNSFERESFSV